MAVATITAVLIVILAIATAAGLALYAIRGYLFPLERRLFNMSLALDRLKLGLDNVETDVAAVKTVVDDLRANSGVPEADVDAAAARTEAIDTALKAIIAPTP